MSRSSFSSPLNYEPLHSGMAYAVWKEDPAKMKIGIIGLPQAGKNTIFKTLIGNKHPVVAKNGRYEISTAMVDVPDPRVDRLVEIFHPRKTTYAKVTYAAIRGLEGNINNGGLSGQLLNTLSQMDGFVHVVRCFESDYAPHPAGSVDPERDIEVLDAEFLLNDLLTIERKLERLGDELRKGGEKNAKRIESEVNLFKKLHAALSAEIPIRDVELIKDERDALSGYGLLSAKPVLILLNLADEQECPIIPYPHKSSLVAHLRGKLEMEFTQLGPDDVEIFMAEYGIKEIGLNKVIRLSYELLGLRSFFTVGEDEVRAWTTPAASTAQQAAGVIHSDLSKGFIRAEIVSYTDLVVAGSMAAARHSGNLRLEGKEYPVKDGDIMHVRFNV